ncbi:hypothetical protein C2E21_6775 [Chlorella sorokiniana]|uniref:DUF3172 domain-containing protein n=1 Tax=Chlorella sorokiniana TaxID=3076 RepID=A0A2P6TJK1_CHLSO|nr:hypothetical protein C2E21_6775 [Chlorella sorokiniana]|eukprot:PRW44264.1 hypothetical protein C2E21_6775 [Chlorella sorokiniana]
MSLLLQPALRLQAAQLCEASTSGRCLVPAPRLAGPWRHQQQRRLVLRRAEFSRDPPPRGAGGSGPAVQPPPAQQPWGPDSYQYPPPPPTAAAPPPRLPPQGGGNGSGPGGSGPGGLSNLTKAFIAGAFILGMGAGIWFDSEVTLEPQNLASTQLVDTKTPNSEVCMANGYSSMVFDQRIFVSFNPFNVYVSQPEVKPGCVLRRANFNVLERRGLVDGQQVQACKRNMNTFAFVGDLDRSPEVSCVYHSEEAENQFLRDPSRAAMGDGFQPRDLPPADGAK